MDIPRAVREEMNALSKEVFGVPSKWQKLLRKGTMQLQTKEIEEEVPGKEGEAPTKKKVTVAKLNEHGQKYSVQKYYTIDEIKKIMLDAKAAMDAAKAAQAERKKQQELEQQHVHEQAAGTVLKG